ncbi:MAG: hypothetical protein GX163_04895 [Bacteroidetes bacterium]|jgi:hypothetical protein|nr:hypothetical protein [Bacteroidota bacterium]
MKTKLVKETIERALNELEEEVEKTVSIEYNIIDENEMQVGSAHISQHGVNISLYGKEFDIHDWASRLNDFLNVEEEV